MNNKQITGKLASEYCKRFQTATTQEVARAFSTEKFCDKVIDRLYYKV